MVGKQIEMKKLRKKIERVEKKKRRIMIKGN